MARSDTLQLSDGTTTLTLMFDSAPGFQMLAQGNEFGLPEHDSLEHASDWQDGSDYVRTRLKNRIWPMRLAIRKSTTADDVADELMELNRLVRQARRYWEGGDVDKVYLHLQLEGATNWTRYDVVDVKYDSLALWNYFNRAAEEIVFGEGFSIQIITKPWGYGAEVTLENSVPDPHFMEDGNSDGLADCWNLVTAATLSIDTTKYLIGGQSQEVITPTSGGSGIRSDTWAVSGAQNACGYAWVFRETGTDDIMAWLNADSTGNIGYMLYSSATTTAQDSQGNTWRRLDISGATTASDTTLDIRIGRNSGAANMRNVFYVDKCYVQVGVTSLPAAGWSSCKTIKNHYETATEGAIPYIDVVDIPGDLDAETKWKLSDFSSSHIFMGRWSKDGGIADFTFWEDATATADTNRTENAYDYTTASMGGSGWTTVSSDTTNFEDNKQGAFYVLIAHKCIDAMDVQWRLYCTASGDRVYTTAPITVTHVAGQWTLLALGPIRALNYQDIDGNAAAYPYHHINVQVRPGGGDVTWPKGTAFGVDFLCYVPTDESGCIAYLPSGDSATADSYTWLYEDRLGNPRGFAIGSLVPSGYAIYSKAEMLGNIPQLTPDKEQRFIVMFSGTGDGVGIHDLTSGESLEATIYYRPRTEFLLGS